MRSLSWLLPRPAPRQCVAGLDVCTDQLGVVVVSGSVSTPEAVSCAELLPLPQGLLQADAVLDPLALGQWLKGYLHDRGLQPDGLCMALDDAWVTRHAVTLSTQLSEQDVAFQLAAELPLGDFADAAQVCWTYTPVVNDGAPLSAAQCVYELGYLAHEPVQRLISLAKAIGVRAWVVEPRSDAQQRVVRQGRTTWVDAESLSPPVRTALGLACAAWAEGGLNFLPHRRWARQRRQRAWAERLGWTVALGACLTCIPIVFGRQWVQTQQSHVIADATLLQRLAAARETQQSLQQTLQHTTAQRNWADHQQNRQRHTLEWHAALAGAPVWISLVRQRQSQWMVQGEALSSEQLRRWVAQLAEQPVWQNAPEVQQLHFARSALASGGWVWQFRVEAQLKDAP